MGLKGQLEDLPLIDMLQIIAFSQKSGYLRVSGPAGRGAVVLSEGRILFAFSWSTMERIREMAREPEKITDGAKRQNIEAALRELAGLREGSFRFELTDEIGDELAGVPIRPFMVGGGLDPQELLLDLAVEIDNERREATSLLELAFEGDPPPEDPFTSEHDRMRGDSGSAQAESSEGLPPSATAGIDAPALTDVVTASDAAPVEPVASRHTVVLVDDESPVTDVVGGELESRGYRVFTASSPGTGAELVRQRRQQGESLLVAVDLKMPTSSGESFYGGFELIRRLHGEHFTEPVLLMVESLSEAARAQAKALGVRRIVYKPTLTKPDRELYRADLLEFTDSVEKQLEKLVEDRSHCENLAAPLRRPSSTDRSGAALAEFLASMTKKLVEPGGSADVSLLVMEVAERFFERGVLFVIKRDAARGLAGFGLGSNEKDCTELVRDLTLSIHGVDSLAQVVSTGQTRRLSEELDGLEGSLFETIGRANASEGILIPMLYNRSTLLLLYGDNGVSGRDLGDVGGLELFMAQAGMALENKLLQRKLGEQAHSAVDGMERGA